MINNVKIGSMNVRGLAEKTKRQDVFNWLKQKKYSILCLQDVHVGQKNRNAFIKDWGGEVLLSSVSTESRGVAVLFNKTLDYKVIRSDHDTNGNLVILELTIHNKTFCLCVLYGPNADTPGFYAGLKNKLLSLDGIPLIICGDWNMVLDYNKDTHGYVRENNTRARKEVQSMINTLELVDIWRANNPQNRKYTWVS